MNRALLSHYNSELAHLRQTAAEFAREFPKIAGRLQLDRDAKEVCPDPFVERLLEGFAFLAARIQVKLDAEFPTFTQGLLETIYPHYLCPTPSMAVVQFEPVLHDPNLAAGFPIPRGTALRSTLGRNQSTPCEYRSAHAVTLWPIRIAEVSYHTRELLQFNLPSNAGARAVLRIRLQATTPDGDFSKIPLDSIPFFLRGADDLPDAIYEQVFSNAIGLVAVKPKGVPAPDQFLPAKDAIRSVGFGSDQALMPETARSFSGYRLLREYFAFRQRFLFSRSVRLLPCFADAPVTKLICFCYSKSRISGSRKESIQIHLRCSAHRPSIYSNGALTGSFWIIGTMNFN